MSCGWTYFVHWKNKFVFFSWGKHLKYTRMTKLLIYKVSGKLTQTGKASEWKKELELKRQRVYRNKKYENDGAINIQKCSAFLLVKHKNYNFIWKLTLLKLTKIKNKENNCNCPVFRKNETLLNSLWVNKLMQSFEQLSAICNKILNMHDIGPKCLRMYLDTCRTWWLERTKLPTT